MELSPDEATVKRENAETTIPADDVAVGETVIVRPARRSRSTERLSRVRARSTSRR